MPKSKINDYIFYKITCLDDSVDLCYVGSTANWKERRRDHKFNCTNENSKKYNTKKYQIIRANGGWVNFKMIEIGQAQQLTLRQAEQIEENYREELKATMNGQRCYVSDQEKQEHKKEHHAGYYEANKDKIKEQKQEYNIKNKDKIKERDKEYRTNNIDKIKARVNEKITCECGCKIRRGDIAAHKKTQKHINLMCSIKNISVVT